MDHWKSYRGGGAKVKKNFPQEIINKNIYIPTDFGQKIFIPKEDLGR